MKIPFKISDQTFEIKPYTTEVEKNILLLVTMDNVSLDIALDTIGAENFQHLTDDQKKVLLYKYRELSIGDEVDIRFKCDKCGTPNETVIQATDFIIHPSRNDDDVKKLDVEVNDETIQEFVDIDVDELDIDEYEEVLSRVKENQEKINFFKECKCIACSTPKIFDMSDEKYILDIMSEDNLMSLYKTYNHLIFFGNYSKIDIDSMYPFERTVFTGLLNKTKEELGT